jgi:hypothetical protein
MMTRAQFEKAQRAAARTAAPIVLGWFFVSILVFIAVSSRFVNWEDKTPQSLLPQIVSGILLIIFCILPIWFTLKVIYRRYGLICPSCGSFLSRDPSILRTGKCQKCQSEVLHG